MISSAHLTHQAHVAEQPGRTLSSGASHIAAMRVGLAPSSALPSTSVLRGSLYDGAPRGRDSCSMQAASCACDGPAVVRQFEPARQLCVSIGLDIHSESASDRLAYPTPNNMSSNGDQTKATCERAHPRSHYAACEVAAREAALGGVLVIGQDAATAPQEPRCPGRPGLRGRGEPAPKGGDARCPGGPGAQVSRGPRGASQPPKGEDPRFQGGQGDRGWGGGVKLPCSRSKIRFLVRSFPGSSGHPPHVHTF